MLKRLQQLAGALRLADVLAVMQEVLTSTPPL
jgi:hypothetical protein